MIAASKRRLIVAGLAAFSLFVTSCGESPEAASISAVIRGGTTAELIAAVPPASYHGGAASAELQQAMADRAQTDLSRYYTGAALIQKVRNAQTAIADEMS